MVSIQDHNVCFLQSDRDLCCLHKPTISPFDIYPFPKRQILDSAKLREFADDKFEFDEKDGKFSERVENAVGKGEIARYEQFLLFPQCFQRTCTTDR